VLAVRPDAFIYDKGDEVQVCVGDAPEVLATGDNELAAWPSALLTEVAEGITTGRELMGSKWQNAECEVIATQTIRGCYNNFRDHGNPFSWASSNVMRGRAQCGTASKCIGGDNETPDFGGTTQCSSPT
jgi:hypothetical protein